ncbi:MAG: tetratricopeptide repeat protein [Labilithrix sp.]|nr:tetratricopeptide repeat protein [Labilithrix sp.]MCW5836053.1 tetratricopeptide repeat protein [Labilithrix sp.]
MPSFLVALVPLAIVLATALVVVIRARRRTKKPRAGREASAFVILEENLWEACAVDDLREPWGRYTTEPVRGFCGVPAGRHRIRTTTASGEATLDFVVYPGEVLAFRLDAERARWEPHDLDADTRSALEAAPVSSFDVSARPKLPGWLVHLRTTIGVSGGRLGGPRLGSATTKAALARSSDDGLDRLRKRLAKLVAIADDESADSDVDALAEARAIGEAVIGRCLTRKEMRALVGSVHDLGARLAANGDTERAMRVLSLGLAVLPGDPELMVIAGCALAARGEPEEALRVLNTALERDRCLEADDVARAMRARMELRSRLGRSVRV